MYVPLSLIASLFYLSLGIYGQDVYITPKDSVIEIEEIEFNNQDGNGIVTLSNSRSIGIWGRLKRKRIIITFLREPSCRYSDNFDGVYDNQTKHYIVNARCLYSGYSQILDSCIRIVGENISSNYSNNTFSFDTKDSSVIIKCNDYYDYEIKLPKSESSILLDVSLKPILSEIKKNKIIFKYNKKKEIAILNDIRYKIVIKE